MSQPPNTDKVLISREAIDNSEDARPALLVHTAQQAVLPRRLDEGVYATLDANGAVQIVETPGYQQKREYDWEHDHDTRPDRVWRKTTLLDAPSFIDYLARSTSGGGTVAQVNLYGDGQLELWADIDARTITAVIDGGDGWRNHTATLQLKLSREWVEWASVDGRLLDQVAFAEFIEDHLSTIAAPDGATLLEVCQTLQVHTSAQFKQQSILATGQRVFKYEEDLETKAGQEGDLKIPGELQLVLRPFQGPESVLITARFRFQVREGVLRIGIKLAEPDRALEDAFTSVVNDVQNLVPVHINRGRG